MGDQQHINSSHMRAATRLSAITEEKYLYGSESAEYLSEDEEYSAWNPQYYSTTVDLAPSTISLSAWVEQALNTSQNHSVVDVDGVNTLMSMGFERIACERALSENANRIDRATDWLLHGDPNVDTLEDVLDAVEATGQEDWEEVMSWLDGQSDRSESDGWTVADEVMSACGSEATEFDVASTCGRTTSANRSQPSAALLQVRAERAAVRAKKHERQIRAKMDAQFSGNTTNLLPTNFDQTRQAEVRREELRKLLRKRFNTVIGRGRPVSEVEALAKIKQRQALHQTLLRQRNQASCVRTSAKNWGRVEKACCV